MGILKKHILDRKVLKYLLLFILISFALSTISACVGKWEEAAYTSYTWPELIANASLRYLTKFLFILVGIYLVRYLVVVHKYSRWMGVGIHAIFALGLTFYSIFTQTLFSNWLFGTNDPLSWDYIYLRAILGTDYNFFMYFAAVAIVYAYYFFKEQKDYEVRQSYLKSQLLDAKMSALQAQLQPHFLFNALNDIASLVDIHPEKSQDAIADLSEMLRQTLNLKNVKFIPIEEELALLKKYLKLEKIRYQDKLEFKIEMDDNLLKNQLPPLLLQPIVENAIKHGYSYAHDSLKIKLQIQVEAPWIVFKISNNGKKMDPSTIHYGTGITNVLSRLDTLYKDDYSFEFFNLETEGVLTLIKIPIDVSS